MASRGSLAYMVLLVAATIALGSLMYAILDAPYQTVQDKSEWENPSAYENAQVGEAAAENQMYQRLFWHYSPVVITFGIGVSILIAARA